MSTDKLYEEKELSWLSFNERVLQEAMDKTVPLIERVRFLGSSLPTRMSFSRFGCRTSSAAF